jgi:hypothetical protein
VVFAGSHNHADAIILAALIFAKQGELAGIKEIRVRVKHPEHAGDGALVDGLVGVDRLGVIGLDDGQDAGEVADGGLIVVRVGGGGADGGAVDASEDARDEQDYNYQD